MPRGRMRNYASEDWEEGDDAREEEDVTPTWEEVMPEIIAVLKNPRATKTAKAGLTRELMRVARMADKWLRFSPRRRF